jgi:hypothetical protein
MTEKTENEKHNVRQGKSLLRIQDKEGRGPFKPGTTSKWSETNYLQKMLKPYFDRGLHIGCAVRGNRLDEWFSKNEQVKLRLLGYQIVTIDNYELVCESSSQVIFASKKKLSEFNKK